MEILLLTALIVLNGAFAMSEIALVTARRARLARQAEQGDTAAAIALKMHDNPTRFLSTVQIGITSIVIGELVPKRIGQFNPEGIARRVARPMYLLALVARPLVRLLAGSTDAMLRLLGKQPSSQEGVIEEEIHALLEVGSESGAIEQQAHDMVRNVFRLDERPISSLMTPRADIVYLDTALPLDENLRRVAESEHSRFPVCHDGLDEVLGILSAKQLLNQTLRGGQADLATQLIPAVFVPESLSGMDLLEQFRASDAHMVLIIDEYGEINGLITLQHVLEAVTGEFKPRNVEDAWAVQREDGSWLLDGLIPIPELKDRLELKSVPDEARGRYHTLSGLVMWPSGRLPQTGDVLIWENWRLEVVDLDGKRIDKVLATPIPPAEEIQQSVGPAPE